MAYSSRVIQLELWQRINKAELSRHLWSIYLVCCCCFILCFFVVFFFTVGHRTRDMFPGNTNDNIEANHVRQTISSIIAAAPLYYFSRLLRRSQAVYNEVTKTDITATSTLRQGDEYTRRAANERNTLVFGELLKCTQKDKKF